MGSSAAYTDLIHKLGGPAMNGFYATNTVNNPYLDDASKNVREWARSYKEKYKEDPAVFSVYGYEVIDLFIQIADKAGPNLTTDTFINTLENFSAPRDMFGADAMTLHQDQAPRLEPRAAVADRQRQVDADHRLHHRVIAGAAGERRLRAPFFFGRLAARDRAVGGALRIRRRLRPLAPHATA